VVIISFSLLLASLWTLLAGGPLVSDELSLDRMIVPIIEPSLLWIHEPFLGDIGYEVSGLRLMPRLKTKKICVSMSVEVPLW